MNDPKNIDRILGYPKNRPVIPIKDMPISRSQNFVFRYRRTSFRKLFQSGDLTFKPGDESCRFQGAVLADIVPNFP